jgi:hypothetical protein
MSVTHYRSSKGPVEIEKMNDHHLHNAIRKHEASGELHEDVLAALRAEQERRGGPPADAR